MAEESTSVWVLGDQLSQEDNTALRQAPPRAPVVMIESFRVACLRRHSRAHLTLLWGAMRHFAKELRRVGHPVDYHAVGPEPSPRDDTTFLDALREHAERHAVRRLLVMTPADWTMESYLDEVRRRLGLRVDVTPNGHFLTGREPLGEEEPKRLTLPDALARTLRRRYHVLVDDSGAPEGGQWHFEPQGRRPEPGGPTPLPRIAPDEITAEVIALVRRRFPDHVGELDDFAWPVTRRDALVWLEDFVAERLPTWAKFQDTVRAGRPVLSHSLLSPLLNLGLLNPLEVVARVERAYHDGDVPLPAAAGFVRQIMGWREFVHAVHRAKMPGHTGENFFEARRPLPRLMWTGETRCACLADVIRQCLDRGHANNTQRLMILGNYLLLTGVDPKAACDWFRAVFVDGREWAALPNVIGLALWADGGTMAAKPYAASANYINKISDHCRRCTYDHATRHGPDACPFNFLYWHFVDRHRECLRPVPRMQRALEFLAKRDHRDLDQCARESQRHLREIGLE